MFKRLFRFKKKTDVRFLPYEDYRTTLQSDASKKNEVTHAWMKSYDALKVSIESSDAEQSPILSINQLLSGSGVANSNNSSNEVDEFITVDGDITERESVQSPVSTSIVDSNSALVNDSLAKELDFSHSLGVFSDTKIYSALISSELRQHNINLKYFNHPKNFISSQYSFFDNITAWIVFLSEDADERFLEVFIDRYIDKPCLFLFAKGNRNKTVQTVSRFLVDNHLVMSNRSTIIN